jgi:hypothetical protein
MAVDSGLAAARLVRSLDWSRAPARAWVDEAVRRVEADANRLADTHLLRYPLHTDWGIDLYNDGWLARHGLDPAPYGETLNHFHRTGRWWRQP